jgi:hypothetical protein
MMEAELLFMRRESFKSHMKNTNAVFQVESDISALT